MNDNEKNFIVSKIKTQYTEKEYTELDALRKLDCKAKKPALIFTYIFGSFSAIILGAGMSLITTDIGKIIGINNPFTFGVVIGIIGLGLSISNYPIYKYILNLRKKQFADEVIALSNKILNA